MKKVKKYSIGLDIGVSSVGWACLTPDFRILKHNGRYAIGVREFEPAQTAEMRRVLRGARRRYNRRIKRIQLLQQTLSPLLKDDPEFIVEIDSIEKHFWRNSNDFENNSLSQTLRFLGMNTRHYPTIYHLRHDLIQKDEKFPPRLIYLALHHLVKYRGHFLYENLNWTNISQDADLQSLLLDYFDELKNFLYDEKEIDGVVIERIIHFLRDHSMTNSDKRNNILKIIGSEYKYAISLIIGLKVKAEKLFPESSNAKLYQEQNVVIDFTADDSIASIDLLTEDERGLVEKAQAIYQSLLLSELLGDAQYVSEAKVIAYEQFRDDLRLLKDIFNKYLDSKDYREVFITSREHQKMYHETRDAKFLCDFDKFLKIYEEEDKFYKKIKTKLEKILEKINENDDEKNVIENILNRIEKRQFLKKLKTKDNAAIPHQNNVYEAEKILLNQKKYYPEITNEMIKRIKQIISFRIPYYVGPLIKDNSKAKFGWMTRNDKGIHVLPWTFNDVVNKSESAEEFINRMTNYCTYLTNEKVLPKHSLLYEKFELFNELNGIQIRSSHESPDKKFRLSKEEKKWLIDNLFSKQKIVTHKHLQEALKISPYKHIIIDESTGGLKNIYGTQKEDRFASSLSTYIDMKQIFGEINDNNFDMIEEIIYWLTVFNEKDIIVMKIKEKYPQVTEKQIKSIIGLNYKGWGRLSKRILNELPADQINHLTVLDIMENEPKVFMEVLATEKYNLEERISKINSQNKENFTKIKYQYIAELQGSPALKKGIWQAILIIEELVDIFGEPENIIIEFAREDAISETPKDRQKKLKELEKTIKKDEKEFKQFLKEHLKKDDYDYKDNRLYLYITQLGKCLYTGEPLDISRLHEYEVDHILPRSFVKDDSLDNLALVKKGMNQLKGYDKMPLEIIPPKKKGEQILFWKKLKNFNLISQKKFNLLMKESFTDQDKERFFARQLVETRQITKHVKELLEERFSDTKIYTVNANIISNLRKHSNLQKLRNLNNKHHAVDAALAALIVQFVINQYGANFLDFDFKYQKAHEKWRKMILKYGKHFFLFSDIDNYDKFLHFKTGKFISGREYLDVLNNEIPWQTTKKIGSNEGAFYDQTIYSPNHPKGRKPQYVSSKLTKGVHSDIKRECSYLISYKFLDNKNREKVESKIVDLFVIEKYQLKNINKDDLALFLAKKVAKGDVVDAKIHKKILKHQLILVDNHPMYFVSAKEMHNAKQLMLGKNTLKQLYHYFLMLKEPDNEDLNVVELKDLFLQIVNHVQEDYKGYFSKTFFEKLIKYTHQINSVETFNLGLEELLKATSAGATRSTKLFEYRYVKKLNLSEIKFIDQSITGLRFRKPKSYKNELWINKLEKRCE